MIKCAKAGSLSKLVVSPSIIDGSRIETGRDQNGHFARETFIDEHNNRETIIRGHDTNRTTTITEHTDGTREINGRPVEHSDGNHEGREPEGHEDQAERDHRELYDYD